MKTSANIIRTRSSESPDSSRKAQVLALYIFMLFTLTVICSGDAWHLSHKVFHDDSYYYLQTAFTFAKYGILSFDGGLTTTNGFHFLWMWILTAVFALANALIPIFTPNIASYIALAMEFGFFYLGLLNLRKITEWTTDFEELAWASVLFWLGYPFFLSGMETALFFFIFSLLCKKISETELFSRRGAVPISDLLTIGSFLSLLILTRYDSAIFAIAFMGYTLFCFRSASRLFAIGAPLALAAALIFLQNLFFGFDSLSDSSRVKAWWADLRWQEFYIQAQHTDFVVVRYLLRLLQHALLMTSDIGIGILSLFKSEFAYAAQAAYFTQAGQ